MSLITFLFLNYNLANETNPFCCFFCLSEHINQALQCLNMYSLSEMKLKHTPVFADERTIIHNRQGEVTDTQTHLGVCQPSLNPHIWRTLQIKPHLCFPDCRVCVFDLHLPIVFRSLANTCPCWRQLRSADVATFIKPSGNDTVSFATSLKKLPVSVPYSSTWYELSVRRLMCGFSLTVGFQKDQQSSLLACWERMEGMCGREHLMPFKWDLFMPCWEIQNTHGPSLHTLQGCQYELNMVYLY